MSLMCFILVISAAFVQQLCFGDGLDKIVTTSNSQLLRVKRVSFGLFLQNNNPLRQKEKVQSKESPEITKPEDNPCNYKQLEKPNFKSSVGTRVSELECYENIWETIQRDYNKRNEAKCFKYRSKNFNNTYVPYVVGGRNATPGEFPHMGGVGWKAIKGTWIFLCGSSLLSTKFMLTAAHCSKVSSRYPNVASTSPEIVRLGDKNIADVSTVENPVIDFKIKRIIVHPKYDPPKKYFDIAIIELVNAVVFGKYIKPACIWARSKDSLPSKATVTGWGIIDSATLKTTTELQAAEVDILDSNVCNNNLKPVIRTHLWNGMAGNQICAGKLSGGVDACQGDSGGPLQVKMRLPSDVQESLQILVGITSFGSGCARTNTPAVYTRISSFIDWIEDIVWHKTITDKR